MGFGKRIVYFFAVNILIITTITITFTVIQAFFGPLPAGYTGLFIFCLIWGFGASFISLALSKVLAKWMMGVKIIDPRTTNSAERDLIQRVHGFARSAKLAKMPEVGVYNSPEVNAFATGPSKNNSLVAVSTGLLQSMDRNAVDGVLGHEVAHIANGDMVTMTLIQAVVNVFVMFFARIIAMFVTSFIKEDGLRFIAQFAIIIVMQILLGFLGMIVVGYFSRAREFRADSGGAKIAGKDKMIHALQSLQRSVAVKGENEPQSISTLKISNSGGGLAALFSTHPPLEKRIAALQRGR